jgi:hypothetical protein
MSSARDHYAVLGVGATASREEIRAAHRRLVHVLHPDRHTGAGEAELKLAQRRMREINDAWSVLSDPARRAEYDRSRSSAPAAGGSTDRGRATAGSPAGASPRPAPAEDPTPWDDDGRRRDLVSDPDEPDLHPATFFLLRRGPIVALLLVGAVLFLVTAYAGSGDEPVDGADLPADTCVLLVERSKGVLVDCSLPNDGEVVAGVAAPLECPEATRYVLVGSRFVCIPVEGR